MDYDGLILSIIQLFTQFSHTIDEIFFQLYNVHLYDIVLQRWKLHDYQ